METHSCGFICWSHYLVQSLHLIHWLCFSTSICCVVWYVLSCLTLFDPVDHSPQAPLSIEFQARILEWVAISSSTGSSRPRDWTRVSRWFLHWQADSLLLNHMGSYMFINWDIFPRSLLYNAWLKSKHSLIMYVDRWLLWHISSFKQITGSRNLF